jgi:hypothetical protein
MGRSRDIADMLSKTELANTSNEALITTFDGVDSAYVSANSTPALVFYSTLDSLPVTGLSVGQQAYVSANNRLYISDGSGWYNKALITLSPTMTLDPTGTITLATDGVTESTVTIVASDSDTPVDGLTYSVESDGNMLGRAVISQDSSVFTIRPLSSDSGATAGTFTLTFSTTDGDNIATDSADFSLTFSTTVDSSSATVLLVKALGAADNNDDISYQRGSNIQLDTLTFTNSGSPQATFFSPYRRGGYSTYLDGNGDYLTVPHDAGFDFGTSDYTVEFWINTPTPGSTAQSIVGTYNNGGSTGWLVQLADVSSSVNIRLWKGGTNIANQDIGSAFSLNTWHHIAVAREGTSLRFFVDGVQQGTDTTNSTSMSYTSDLYIGKLNHPTVPQYTSGYIRDLRIVKGTAVYTSDFTAPTEALTAISGSSFLGCHLPYFGDGSTNDHSITVNGDAHTAPFGPYDYNPHITLSQSGYDSDIGSTYFDGSSYVYASAIGSEYTFGSGDFTVEAWYFPTTLSSGADAVVTTADTNDRQGIWMGVNNDKMYVLTGQGTTWLNDQSTASLVLNQWNHMAAVRNGNTVYGYLNGTQVLSYSETRTLTNSNNAIRIGGRSVASQISTGYVADVRVIKGTAQYTAAFTPPSSRLQWVTNTVLQKQNVLDPRIYDVTSSNGVLAFGNAQTNTSTRKFTTSSSIYLDGTGDYLVVPRTEASWIGDGSDFTIEAWVYKSNSPSLWTIYGQWGQATNYEQFLLAGTSTWNFYWRPFDPGNEMLASSTATSLNTWTHVAVTRQGDLFTLWVNGTSEATYNTSMTDVTYGAALADQAVGTYFNVSNNPGAGGYAQGYIQDLRVSKGKARYTANFTPPTEEFEL